MSIRRVLIVEDEEVVAADLSVRLKRMGHEVLAAVTTGEAAVEAIRSLRPDVVLMDIMLAGAMTGIEAATHIRRALDVPVIFLTAHSDNHTLVSAMGAEPHAYIVKPFDEANLRASIELVPYRHAMEKRLKMVNQWFSAALLNVGEAVIAGNDRGKVVFINPAAENLTGWSLDEAVGRGTSEILRLLQADSRRPLPDPAEVALREGEVVHLTDDTLAVSRSGGEVLVDDCATRVVDQKGDVSGVVVILSDISRRKAAAERIRVLDERVRELTEQTARHASEKEHIAGVIAAISHDLRGPLRTIDGFSQMLAETYSARLDEAGNRFLNNIQTSARRLSSMLDDYLAFLRIDQSDPRYDQSVEMGALATRAFADVVTQPGQPLPEFRCADLPEARGDAGMFRQVFTNLLSNAVKYSSRRECPVVEVGARNEGTINVFWVKDNGAGFESNYSNKLFQPFQRLHRDTEFPGNGVGLAIVKRIVEKHGGSVWADGVPGVGATFYFSLPAAQPMSP